MIIVFVSVQLKNLGAVHRSDALQTLKQSGVTALNAFVFMCFDNANSECGLINGVTLSGPCGFNRCGSC